MRHVFAVALFAVALPIYGQEKSHQPAPHKETARQETQSTPQPPPKTVSVINEQASAVEEIRAKKGPQGYLSRLFSPENLPNVGLFIAGIFAIIVAIRTLRAIKRQADIMRGQLTVPYRAYLGLIEPDKPITDRVYSINAAKFPIENIGHVRAKVTAIDAEVIIQDCGGKELFRRSKTETLKNGDGEIPPEKTSSYAVTVRWPSNIPNSEKAVISVAITYKTGFKGLKPDIFSFVRVFRTSSQDWSKGYWGTDIDLTEDVSESQKAD